MNFEDNMEITETIMNSAENTNIMEKAVTFMGSMDITEKVTDVGNTDIMVRVAIFTENRDITENMDSLS